MGPRTAEAPPAVHIDHWPCMLQAELGDSRSSCKAAVEEFLRGPDAGPRSFLGFEGIKHARQFVEKHFPADMKKQKARGYSCSAVCRGQGKKAEVELTKTEDVFTRKRARADQPSAKRPRTATPASRQASPSVTRTAATPSSCAPTPHEKRERSAAAAERRMQVQAGRGLGLEPAIPESEEDQLELAYELSRADSLLSQEAAEIKARSEEDEFKMAIEESLKSQDVVVDLDSSLDSDPGSPEGVPDTPHRAGDSVEPGQGVRVLMDTRERKRNPAPRGLLDRVQAHARFHVERTALRIGDYQVLQGEQRRVVVERKTLNDLIGRSPSNIHWDQLGALDGEVPVLVLEGKMNGPYCLLEDGDSATSLEDSAAVWRFVADAVRRLPKLRVIRTSDTEATARLVGLLAAAVDEGWAPAPPRPGPPGPPLEVQGAEVVEAGKRAVGPSPWRRGVAAAGGLAASYAGVTLAVRGLQAAVDKEMKRPGADGDLRSVVEASLLALAVRHNVVSLLVTEGEKLEMIQAFSG